MKVLSAIEKLVLFDSALSSPLLTPGARKSLEALGAAHADADLPSVGGSTRELAEGDKVTLSADGMLKYGETCGISESDVGVVKKCIEKPVSKRVQRFYVVSFKSNTVVDRASAFELHKQ